MAGQLQEFPSKHLALPPSLAEELSREAAALDSFAVSVLFLAADDEIKSMGDHTALQEAMLFMQTFRVAGETLSALTTDALAQDAAVALLPGLSCSLWDTLAARRPAPPATLGRESDMDGSPRVAPDCVNPAPIVAATRHRDERGGDVAMFSAQQEGRESADSAHAAPATPPSYLTALTSSAAAQTVTREQWSVGTSMSPSHRFHGGGSGGGLFDVGSHGGSGGDNAQSRSGADVNMRFLEQRQQMLLQEQAQVRQQQQQQALERQQALQQQQAQVRPTLTKPAAPAAIDFDSAPSMHSVAAVGVEGDTAAPPAPRQSAGSVGAAPPSECIPVVPAANPLPPREAAFVSPRGGAIAAQVEHEPFIFQQQPPLTHRAEGLLEQQQQQGVGRQRQQLRLQHAGGEQHYPYHGQQQQAEQADRVVVVDEEHSTAAPVASELVGSRDDAPAASARSLLPTDACPTAGEEDAPPRYSLDPTSTVPPYRRPQWRPIHFAGAYSKTRAALARAERDCWFSGSSSSSSLAARAPANGIATSGEYFVEWAPSPQQQLSAAAQPLSTLEGLLRDLSVVTRRQGASAPPPQRGGSRGVGGSGGDSRSGRDSGALGGGAYLVRQGREGGDGESIEEEGAVPARAAAVSRQPRVLHPIQRPPRAASADPLSRHSQAVRLFSPVLRQPQALPSAASPRSKPGPAAAPTGLTTALRFSTSSARAGGRGVPGAGARRAISPSPARLGRRSASPPSSRREADAPHRRQERNKVPRPTAQLQLYDTTVAAAPLRRTTAARAEHGDSLPVVAPSPPTVSAARADASPSPGRSKAQQQQRVGALTAAPTSNNYAAQLGAGSSTPPRERHARSARMLGVKTRAASPASPTPRPATAAAPQSANSVAPASPPGRASISVNPVAAAVASPPARGPQHRQAVNPVAAAVASPPARGPQQAVNPVAAALAAAALASITAASSRSRHRLRGGPDGGDWEHSGGASPLGPEHHHAPATPESSLGGEYGSLRRRLYGALSSGSNPLLPIPTGPVYSSVTLALTGGAGDGEALS